MMKIVGATYQVARKYLKMYRFWGEICPIKPVASSAIWEGVPPPPRIHTVSILLPKMGVIYGQLKGNFRVFEEQFRFIERSRFLISSSPKTTRSSVDASECRPPFSGRASSRRVELNKSLSAFLLLSLNHICGKIT